MLARTVSYGGYSLESFNDAITMRNVSGYTEVLDSNYGSNRIA